MQKSDKAKIVLKKNYKRKAKLAFLFLCKKLLHKVLFSLISVMKSVWLKSFLTEILQEGNDVYSFL